jgi:hypothetical protein
VTVFPSGLATQPIGEPAPAAEGLWQLKLPVPFPLRFVSEGADLPRLCPSASSAHSNHKPTARRRAAMLKG